MFMRIMRHAASMDKWEPSLLQFVLWNVVSEWFETYEQTVSICDLHRKEYAFIIYGKKGYQMDYHNGREAEMEAALDVAEGADIIMVKPALPYLDVIARLRPQIKRPMAAYCVSGEYAMLQMAVSQGLVNPDIIYESHIAIKRAGADIILSYFAPDLAKIL